MISELATLPMQDVRLPLLLGIIPIITMLILQIILSELQLRSEKLRKIVDGRPSILLKDGILDTKALREQRINIDDLMEELRVSGYFNFDDLAYIILENNGQLSVIAKTMLSPVTKKDLQIPCKQDILPTILVVNGKIQQEGLRSIHKNEEWLNRKLKSLKIKKVEDVYIAMMDSHNKFFCQEKNKL